MELLRGTAPVAKFYLPTSNTSVVDASWTLNNLAMGSLTFDVDSTAATAQLPYMQSDGELEIFWTFVIDGQTYTDSEHYEVVTPLLTKQEALEVYETSLTDDDYRNAESAVRLIINAHTGQSFGRSEKVRIVRAFGANKIALPERLISISSFNGVTAVNPGMIDESGFYLEIPRFEGWPPPVKADYYGVNEETVGVIADPYVPRRGAVQYAIEGVWGYNFVPAPVKEAAKLLLNDYACDDIMYRDRYLQSVSAADWRIQFNNGAYSDTGNARANQLLAGYLLPRGWAIV